MSRVALVHTGGDLGSLTDLITLGDLNAYFLNQANVLECLRVQYVDNGVIYVLFTFFFIKKKT